MSTSSCSVSVRTSGACCADKPTASSKIDTMATDDTADHTTFLVRAMNSSCQLVPTPRRVRWISSIGR
jgi:hypothetical protein